MIGYVVGFTRSCRLWLNFVVVGGVVVVVGGVVVDGGNDLGVIYCIGGMFC